MFLGSHIDGSGLHGGRTFHFDLRARDIYMHCVEFMTTRASLIVKLTPGSMFITCAFKHDQPDLLSHTNTCMNTREYSFLLYASTSPVYSFPCMIMYMLCLLFAMQPLTQYGIRSTFLTLVATALQ